MEKGASLQWLEERFIFEILSYENGLYVLEFALRKELHEMREACFNYNEAYGFFPEYLFTIRKDSLSRLVVKWKEMEKIDNVQAI